MFQCYDNYTILIVYSYLQDFDTFTDDYSDGEKWFRYLSLKTVEG